MKSETNVITLPLSQKAQEIGYRRHIPYKLLKTLKGFTVEETHQQIGEGCQEDYHPKSKAKVDILTEDHTIPNKDSTVHNLSRKTTHNRDSEMIGVE